MTKKLYEAIPFIAITLCVACAGVPLPFVNYRLGHFPKETDRDELHTDCTDLTTLNDSAELLKLRHLDFVRSGKEEDAIKIQKVRDVLRNCNQYVEDLTVPQIKQELYGDVQIVNESEDLRLYGGIAFDYKDVVTLTEVGPLLHVKQRFIGPERRIVAIYRLDDGIVVHYNVSGPNDLGRIRTRWPIDEFFGFAIRTIGDAIKP